jgi:hypothetical protein
MRFVASDEAVASLWRVCDRHFNEAAFGRFPNTFEHVPDELVRDILASFSGSIFESVGFPADGTGSSLVLICISAAFQRHAALAAEKYVICNHSKVLQFLH